VRDAELTEADATKAAQAFDDCTDQRKLVAGMVSKLFEADSDQEKCIDDAVTDDAVHKWIVADLQGKVTDNVYIVAGRGCMSTDDEDARAAAALAGGLGERDGMSPAQARCVGKAMVDKIGTYELTAAGVLTNRQTLATGLHGASLNATDATLAADATASCVTIEQMLTRTMVGGGKTGSGAKVKACFTQAFDPDTFHQYLVLSYMGKTDTGLDPATTKKLADCLAQVLKEQRKKG
jgi:hypothetical protein